MDQLCFGISGENKNYGTPINPQKPSYVPGGSSSGSAVAVAGQIVDFALGIDSVIGCIRVPASFCGIFGFKLQLVSCQIPRVWIPLGAAPPFPSPYRSCYSPPLLPPDSPPAPPLHHCVISLSVSRPTPVVAAPAPTATAVGGRRHPLFFHAGVALVPKSKDTTFVCRRRIYYRSTRFWPLQSSPLQLTISIGVRTPEHLPSTNKPIRSSFISLFWIFRQRFHFSPLSISLFASHGTHKFLLDTVLYMYPLSDTHSNMDTAELLKEKGNAAYKGKQWNKARSFYTEAIKLNDANATYYSNRAAAYLELGCYQQAEEDCSKAISLDKKYVKAYFRRGTAKESLLFYQEAIEDFKHVLVLEPQNKAAVQAEKRLRKLIS